MSELKGLDYADLLELGKIGVDAEDFFPEHYERQRMFTNGSMKFPKGKGFHKKPFKKCEDVVKEEEIWEKILETEGLNKDVDKNDPDYLIFSFKHLTDQKPLFTKHGTAHFGSGEEKIKEVDIKDIKTFVPKFEPISRNRIPEFNHGSGWFTRGSSHGKRGRKPTLRKHKRRTGNKRHKLSKEVREIVMA